MDDGVTRGGPLMQTAAEWRMDLSTETSSSKPTLMGVSFSGSRDELDGWEAELGVEMRFRPGTRWQVSVEPSISRSVNARQYVGTRPGGTAATFGSRYLFGEISRSEVAAQFRAAVAITPELTFEGYVEPFASSGQYTRLGELSAARTFALREYGTDGTGIALVNGRYEVTDGDAEFTFSNPDFNIRSFRSNLVFRWEWRPGSTAYLVWQQNRFEARDPAQRVGTGGLFQALGAPGDNVLAFKVSYWLAK
jgi:hypothetical protein